MAASPPRVLCSRLRGDREGGTEMDIEVQLEQAPRQFYRLVADLSDQLVELGVPQHHVDRALDKVERIIAEALGHAEEETDEEEESEDDADDEEDSEGD
jgi:hypothetical protein